MFTTLFAVLSLKFASYLSNFFEVDMNPRRSGSFGGVLLCIEEP